MMTTGSNDSLALDDEDRLPWLEPAYDDDFDEGEVSLARLGIFIAAGLALLGIIVGGIYLLRSQTDGGQDARIIAAPKDDYKVPASDPSAKSFDGEGDASFAASEGLNRIGTIDPSRLPEVPLTPTGSAASGTAKSAVTGSTSVSAPVTDNSKAAAAPSGTQAPSAPSSGPAIQLGAYPSDAVAQEAWVRFSKRFDYLSALSHSVQPVTVGGTRYYRLRVSVPEGQASKLCGKLKVAGESCIVVS